MTEVLEPFRVPIILEHGSFDGRDAVLAQIKADCAETIRAAAASQRKVNLHQLKDLHEKPYAKPLVDFVSQRFDAIFRELGYEADDAHPVLTAMWANAASEGMGIHVHSHPNSFYSGVWYPHGCKGAGISFKNPIPEIHVIAPTCRTVTPYNAGSWTYEFEEESYLYFPAWLQHWSLPNKSATELRYSVSFNFFLKGNVKRESGMSTLEL